ncbi:hypothetical protein A2U01_0066440, partial [Trifolium medium]|nr:hypothetical protein [Trifolium medium]
TRKASMFWLFPARGAAIAASDAIMPLLRSFLAVLCVRRRQAASGAASLASDTGGAASGAIQEGKVSFVGCWLRAAQQILRAAQ